MRHGPLLPSLFAAAALTPGAASASMTQEFSVSGRYVLSVDGGGSHTSTSYSMSINKPSSTATIHKIYATAVTVPYESDPGASVLSVDGTTLSLGSSGYESTYQVYSRYDDVTTQLETAFNAFSVGANTITVEESGSAASVDGSGIVVIWEDTSLTTNNTITLALGVDSIYTGYAQSLTTTAMDTSSSDFLVDLGLGLSYSTGDSSQIANFAFNGTTITTTAGGYDDGTYGNGGLVTVGGDGDSSASERYDVTSYVSNGDTSFDLELTSSGHQYDYVFLVWVEATDVVLQEYDRDSDGLLNDEEVGTYGSDPDDDDTDDDGLTDGDEVLVYDTDPTDRSGFGADC
jgi:hypothetical protein